MRSSKTLKRLVFIIFATIFVSPSFAQEEIPPDVYDENTEVTIRGGIFEIITPSRGPVVIKVKTENRVYNVITAPIWFLNRYNLDLKVGERIEITGSKMVSKGGEIFIIARKCKVKGCQNSCHLRDEYMRPIWRGGMHRQ